MNKPWSVTTTLRNPDRLRDFLSALRPLEGAPWTAESQRHYQISLIQNRLYGFGSTQFYSGLSPELIDLISNISNDISAEQAEMIFESKNYEDPAMRGRQSINPLKKFGLVTAANNQPIRITDLGKMLLRGELDIGEMLFRSFLK